MAGTRLVASSVDIRRIYLTSPTAQSLIANLNAELTERYPEEGANFFHLAEDEVAEGRGGFFVAYLNGMPIGCGALRMIEPAVAEFKRMYVAPTTRGQGVGRRIVEVLEQESRRLGARRIVLETGPRQPEAIALYTRAGFTEIPLYGEYIGSRFSVCMAKDLRP
jgi:GNAT superfamily N-acetyltransferase